jgi:hypothetical protein
MPIDDWSKISKGEMIVNYLCKQSCRSPPRSGFSASGPPSLGVSRERDRNQGERPHSDRPRSNGSLRR